LHPSCTPETLSLATELGFTILEDIADDDNIPSENGETSTYCVLPHAKARLDGLILNAIMRGLPLVSVEWLCRWKERKLWKNEHPNYEDYPVSLHINNNSTGLNPKHILEKAQEAVESQPLQNLKILWKPHPEEESVDRLKLTLGLQSAAVLAGGKVLAWPSTKAKAPKRDKKNYILALASKDKLKNIPAYLQNELKWATYDDLIALIITRDSSKYLHNAEEAVEEKVNLVGTVPDSEDETTEVTGIPAVAAAVVVVEDEEEEAKGAGKAGGKKGKSKQSPVKSPSRATRSKRKADSSIEQLSEDEDRQQQQQQQQEVKSTPPRGRKPKTDAAASPASLKRQRTRGASKSVTSADFKGEDSSTVTDAVASPPSVHPSPNKRGGQKAAATIKTAPPAPKVHVPDAPAAAAADVEMKSKSDKRKAIKTSLLPSPAKTSKKTAERGQGLIILPPGEGWKLAKVKTEEGGPSTTTKPTSITDAAPAAVSAPEDPAAAIKEEGNKTFAVDTSAVIVDTSLIVAPFTDDHEHSGGNNNSGAGGFKAFRRKGSTVGYGNGGTARLPRIPFDPEPYREGQGYKDKINMEFLREEAEREAATKAADALFDANLKPKKDKKAQDEGKRKLYAMLPEAARRRLEKKI
jgi:hypothetical protein